jgi:putative salt-induced outer membrane protein YdiY
MEGGKMVFKSDKAGKVTVDMKDLKTFSSTGPISIKLNDGTVVHAKIDAGPDGQIGVAPGGALQGQNLPVASIKTVNFKEDWTGTITAGGELARGNTDTDTLNLAFNLVRRTERDRFTIDGGFLYGRQRTETTVAGVTTSSKSETANDWFIAAKYDYFFNPKLYGYINGRLERDLIAGISLRVTPGAGLGYQWADDPDFHFRTEGGISYLYRSYTHDGGTAESVAVRLAYHIDKKLNDKVSVFHNLEYFPGLDSINDYFFLTDAGIRASMTEKMFAEFKIQEQYDSQPAPGKGHNDTRFILGVGINF